MRRQHVLIAVAALGIAAALGLAVMRPTEARGGGRGNGGFALAFSPVGRDAAGRFMGGTELRLLEAHGGKLFAGNGYWEDRPGAEGPQAAQILVLDQPSGRWRVDQAFPGTMPSGRPRHLAVSALREVTFMTDGSGARLAQPVSLLLASTWDLTGTTQVFSRDDAGGGWTATRLGQGRPAPDFLPQVRSFGSHRDRVTGVDQVFAGEGPHGIYRGTYDATELGGIRWAAQPELDLSQVSTAGFSGLEGRLRISGFAACNDRLYAAVGQMVFERIDGVVPRWRPVYSNPQPGHSETGLRGLTAVHDPAGGPDMLLAAVEGSAARIVRIDPTDGSEVSELDLRRFLGAAWHMPVTDVITAYNDMTKLPGRGDTLLMGLEAFIPRRATPTAGHSLVDVGYGMLESGGWYLQRSVDAHYTLHRIPTLPGMTSALVAVRSIRVSPFAEAPQQVYFAGYDANKAAAHDTAWIVRADVATVLGTANAAAGH